MTLGTPAGMPAAGACEKVTVLPEAVTPLTGWSLTHASTSPPASQGASRVKVLVCPSPTNRFLRLGVSRLIGWYEARALDEEGTAVMGT